MFGKTLCNRIALLSKSALNGRQVVAAKQLIATSVARENGTRQLTGFRPSLLCVDNVDIVQKRFKKKGKQSQKEEEEEEEEEESDEEKEDEADLYSIPTRNKFTTPSLKVEFVLSRCLVRSRAIFEEALAKHRLRLNGEQLDDKNYEACRGDVFDYIFGRNKENYELLDVTRVEIISVGDKLVKGRYEVEVEKIQRLTINNYKNKWEGLSLAENPRGTG